MRLSLSLLLAALPFVLASAHHPNVNHRELAKRAKGDVEKRGADARWSFYATGLGACGGYNNDNDFIVALNQQTFGYSYPSKYCNKMITMTYGGKTTQAKIVDSCPGCPYRGLDLSPGLFSFFASQDKGIIYGDWWFSDGGDSGGGGGGGEDPKPDPPAKPDPPKTTPKPDPPKTTPKPDPPKTTPKEDPPPYTPPTTTKTSTKLSSSSSVHHTSSASPTSNSLAAPSGSVPGKTDSDPQNLYEFSQALLGLTGMVAAAGNAN
ncbi:hypothetical protein C8J57DRAFT_1285493 [Mycena rebaudengoi]|nr:hypothetical protein C8J57DRAFT_1285493 [Mycena rebaudengoi]